MAPAESSVKRCTKHRCKLLTIQERAEFEVLDKALNLIL